MDEKELTIIDEEETTENDTVELNKVKSIYLPDLTLDEICFDTIKPKENKKKTTEEILQEIEDFKNALYPPIEESKPMEEPEWYKEIENAIAELAKKIEEKNNTDDTNDDK